MRTKSLRYKKSLRVHRASSEITARSRRLVRRAEGYHASGGVDPYDGPVRGLPGTSLEGRYGVIVAFGGVGAEPAAAQLARAAVHLAGGGAADRARRVRRQSVAVDVRRGRL